MTKPSEHFRDTIREYLEQRAGADALFAASCAKEHKNLDDCITFILNYVQQSGCNGFTDAEIYSLAVHYYDEDDIDVGRPLDCRVVVNHTIVLTEEEQREAHEQALRKATDEAYAKITHKSKSQPASNAANAANQQSVPHQEGKNHLHRMSAYVAGRSANRPCRLPALRRATYGRNHPSAHVLE